MDSTLVRDLEALGYRGRVVAFGRLQELLAEIEARHEQGDLDEDLYREYLAGFDHGPPKDLPQARSLIVVAYPDPVLLFSFTWQGQSLNLAVPPTYLQAESKDRQVQQALAGLLEARGFHVAPVVLPKKLLAVRSGLAAYGRNNITYVEGLGSYHRLAVFCSDRPCTQEQWREARLLARCERSERSERCSACQRGCPTGAIDPGRVLLRAERCLTFWSEKPGRVPFPPWLAGVRPDCLVGCLHCQTVCPENRAVLDRREQGAAFSEAETALLLQGADDLPAALREKLERWDLVQFLDILARNLRACLQR